MELNRQFHAPGALPWGKEAGQKRCGVEKKFLLLPGIELLSSSLLRYGESGRK
jgi:hypothetical protein